MSIRAVVAILCSLAVVQVKDAAVVPEVVCGPDIEFRLRSTTSGFHKLFAQVRVEGRICTLAFGFTVAPQL